MKRKHLPPPAADRSLSEPSDRPVYRGIIFCGDPTKVPNVPYSQWTVILPNGRGVHPDHVPEEFKAQLAEEDRICAEQWQEWLDYKKALAEWKKRKAERPS
jgi:hypothetical protein